MLRSLIKNELIWLPEKGMGYFPAAGHPYNADYFAKYERMADTDMGWAITQARIDMVARHFGGQVIDIGIGCGHFVKSRPGTMGYDVNPAGIEWLSKRGLLVNIYRERFDAVTFWDSLEHIHDPAKVLNGVRQWAFVSIPIFRDCAHILKSHHFRKDEHYWYFTDSGLVAWFENNGFELAERNDIETQLGRDSIMSYAFRRKTQ